MSVRTHSTCVSMPVLTAQVNIPAPVLMDTNFRSREHVKTLTSVKQATNAVRTRCVGTTLEASGVTRKTLVRNPTCALQKTDAPVHPQLYAVACRSPLFTST